MAAQVRLNPDKLDQVREEILDVLSQSPRDHNIERTRWRLEDLLRVIQQTMDVAINSISTLHRWLSKLDIAYRHGWEHIVSPDPHRELKLSVVEQVLHLAQTCPGQVEVLWLDELTVYRLPSTAPTWTSAHGRAAKAHHTPGANEDLRIAGALNTRTGQVTKRMAQKMGVTQLRAFYHQIRRDYPDAEQIFVIQDCWPVHFHPDVSQTAHELGIWLVPLPTYSSWRNPIEKLWRWLKQTIIHMHPWADDWARLKYEIRNFHAQFRHESPDLLRYVGLLD